jgi:hypothetical protein
LRDRRLTAGYPLFFCLKIKKILQKSVEDIPKKVYNKNIERRTKQISAKRWKGETAGNGREETKEKAYQLARAGGKCTDRLNRRDGTNHNRQAIKLEPRRAVSPPPIKNISQTQSRVKSMILKLGIFLIVAGLVKLIIALVMRIREKRGKS